MLPQRYVCLYCKDSKCPLPLCDNVGGRAFQEAVGNEAFRCVV
jgi:hypothetical protein